MKNLFYFAALIAVSLGLSSCCKMFGLVSQTSGYRTETYQKKLCGYDIVTKEVYAGGSAKSGKGGMQTIEERVPRYKTVTKKVRLSCGPCVRLYCPKKDCCGTTHQSVLVMASAQGWSGSPNIGLIPTMKQIAP